MFYVTAPVTLDASLCSLCVCVSGEEGGNMVYIVVSFP